MAQATPEEPKFVKNITFLQKILASVVLSMWFVVWAMGWSVTVSIFAPDYVKALTLFRVIFALTAFALTSIVGYHQIRIGINRLIELWDIYKKMKDLNKGE